VAEITDELLMAYADGALDPADRARVEAAIQAHPPYREKVQKFDATRKLVQQAFRADLDNTRARSLIDQIHQRAGRPTATVAPITLKSGSHSEARGRGFASWQPVPVAIAASVLLLIGASLGWWLESASIATARHPAGFVRFSNGGLLAQSALHELLEKTRSGIALNAQGDGEAWKLQSSFSFPSVDRTPCRRYEIDGERAGRFAGYACRLGKGQWFVQGHVKLAATASKGGGGFVPASGEGEVALEEAIRITMDGDDVYESQKEEELIRQGWATLR
jgi:hypothetical protein